MRDSHAGWDGYWETYIERPGRAFDVLTPLGGVSYAEAWSVFRTYDAAARAEGGLVHMRPVPLARAIAA